MTRTIKGESAMNFLSLIRIYENDHLHHETPLQSLFDINEDVRECFNWKRSIEDLTIYLDDTLPMDFFNTWRNIISTMSPDAAQLLYSHCLVHPTALRSRLFLSDYEHVFMEALGWSPLHDELVSDYEQYWESGRLSILQDMTTLSSHRKEHLESLITGHISIQYMRTGKLMSHPKLQAHWKDIVYAGVQTMHKNIDLYPYPSVMQYLLTLQLQEHQWHELLEHIKDTKTTKEYLSFYGILHLNIPECRLDPHQFDVLWEVFQPKDPINLMGLFASNSADVLKKIPLPDMERACLECVHDIEKNAGINILQLRGMECLLKYANHGLQHTTIRAMCLSSNDTLSNSAISQCIDHNVWDLKETQEWLEKRPQRLHELGLYDLCKDYYASLLASNTPQVDVQFSI